MSEIRVTYQDGDKGLCTDREYLVLVNSPFSKMIDVEFTHCDKFIINRFQDSVKKFALRNSATRVISHLPKSLTTLVLENVPNLEVIRGIPRGCRIVKLGKNLNPDLEVQFNEDVVS